MQSKLRLTLADLCFLATFTLPLNARSAYRATTDSTPVYTFKVIHTYPHDSNAFTQGLVYHDGFLYEGTGLNGRSSLRKVRLETGEVLKQIDLPSQYFGEGIALLNDHVIQLTWRAQLGFIYDLKDFHLLRQFTYKGEGWGLTTDGHDVFMSDGTAQVRVLDGRTLKEQRRFTVRDGDEPIDQLNELEIVEGELYANVWQTNRIARISLKTGKVLGWIDLKGILGPMYRLESNAVLNGIAYDAEKKRLFVTGKLWPSLFEIKLVRKPN